MHEGGYKKVAILGIKTRPRDQSGKQHKVAELEGKGFKGDLSAGKVALNDSGLGHPSCCRVPEEAPYGHSQGRNLLSPDGEGTGLLGSSRQRKPWKHPPAKTLQLARGNNT